jgi:quercetin dioxygenase-like cupin family protein
MRQVLITSAAAAALLASATYIAAAEEAPKDNKGFTVPKSQVVELGAEIEGMSGRQLRMRILKIEPGGHIGIHTHKNRPAVVYFLQGTDTVIQGDGSSKAFHAGDMSGATKDTTHWHRNDGKDDVLLVAVDVFQPPQK